jgi:hypothetical protein
MNITRIKHLAASAVLAMASLGAQASAILTFTGTTDSGPLAGQSYDGSFAFDAPAAGFDGAVTLQSFTLNAFGQTYTLADADTSPMAWFAAGQFLGLDFIDADATNPALRPFVTLTAGFFDISEAFLAYDTSGAGIQGFGSFTPTAAVPEPASLGLTLAALGGIAVALRRRRA